MQIKRCCRKEQGLYIQQQQQQSLVVPWRQWQRAAVKCRGQREGAWHRCVPVRPPPRRRRPRRHRSRLAQREGRSL